MAKVKVYTTPTCPWCVRAKEFLNRHKVKYAEVDVASDDKARDEMVEKSGQMGVPVIEVDGKIVVGFDREALTKILKLQ
ncbi:glutathione S-transferase N-terminal domain-containing protein [Candidatus Woesearchaeota archaeon]|nr:glutathione S-transferase N-terminal domain-containing protein [Candidatus Woesearchaeota archaeon]